MTGGSFPDDAPWTPPELAPRLVRVLASGRADALAGRYLHAEHDDIDELIRASRRDPRAGPERDPPAPLTPRPGCLRDMSESVSETDVAGRDSAVLANSPARCRTSRRETSLRPSQRQTVSRGHRSRGDSRPRCAWRRDRALRSMRPCSRRLAGGENEPSSAARSSRSRRGRRCSSAVWRKRQARYRMRWRAVSCGVESAQKFSTDRLKPTHETRARADQHHRRRPRRQPRPDPRSASHEARGAGADLVLFPELAVTGYPPEDLLLRPGFIRAAEASLARDRRATHAASSRSSASPTSTATSSTPARSAPTAR